MNVTCGNPQHPEGPWHPAAPLPASWEWRAQRRYRRNVRKHGCGCDTRCQRAPRGWWCSREVGHDGPCAARPTWWNRSRFASIGRRLGAL